MRKMERGKKIYTGFQPNKNVEFNKIVTVLQKFWKGGSANVFTTLFLNTLYLWKD